MNIPEGRILADYFNIEELDQATLASQKRQQFKLYNMFSLV